MLTAFWELQYCMEQTSTKSLNYKDVLVNKSGSQLHSYSRGLGTIRYIVSQLSQINVQNLQSLAPVYLHELFQMRDINLDNTASK